MNKNESFIGKIGKYTSILIACIAVISIIMFLMTPKLSLTLFGYGSFGVTTGIDSSLSDADLKIAKKESFDSLEKGDIIVFELGNEEYPLDHGIKIYEIMAVYDNFVHVHQRGEAISYPWNVDESMYYGTVVLSVPVLGMIVSFIKSGFGLAIVLFNLAIVGLIFYLLKHSSKRSKRSNEES